MDAHSDGSQKQRVCRVVVRATKVTEAPGQIETEWHQFAMDFEAPAEMTKFSRRSDVVPASLLSVLNGAVSPAITLCQGKTFSLTRKIHFPECVVAVASAR